MPAFGSLPLKQQISELVDYQISSSELEYWPVYTIRSPKPRPDEKSKIDPWEWEGLPVLQNEGELPDQ